MTELVYTKQIHNTTPAAALKRQAKYREANRDVVRARVAASHAKRPRVEKRAVDNARNQHARVVALMLLGGKCEHCGHNDMRVLQFDHINGGGTAENRRLRSIGVTRNVLREPFKYQVLCANCNWIKRSEREEDRPRLIRDAA